MSKKVLLIVPHLGIGGQERIAVETASLLQSRGYKVMVAVFERVAKEYDCPVQVVDLGLAAAPSAAEKAVRVLQRCAALKKLKKAFGADVSYSFGDIANVSNAMSKRKGEKCILSVHGFGSVPKSRLSGMVYGWLCRTADITACVSKQISNAMHSATGISREKFTTLYNPYNIRLIREKAQSRKNLPHPCFIAVGRLEEVKGYENLLHAFALVNKQIPEAKLLFVGDGSCRTALEKLTGNLNLTDSVLFAGMQENPYAWLAGADAFVLSSYSEGFPNAMIEAMACGLPVVSVDCPSGPREILLPEHEGEISSVTETACGFLCPAIAREDSPNEKKKKQSLLAEAMLRLLNSQDLSQKNDDMRNNSLARASQFDGDAYLQQLEKLF